MNLHTIKLQSPFFRDLENRTCKLTRTFGIQRNLVTIHLADQFVSVYPAMILVRGVKEHLSFGWLPHL